MSTADGLHHAPARVSTGALIPDRAAYQRLYDESLRDPDAFWGRMAREHLGWIHEFREVSDNDWR